MKSLIFWDVKNKESNEAAIRKIKELQENTSVYDEFIAQDKLLPQAEDFVADKFEKLRDYLNHMK